MRRGSEGRGGGKEKVLVAGGGCLVLIGSTGWLGGWLASFPRLRIVCAGEFPLMIFFCLDGGGRNDVTRDS